MSSEKKYTTRLVDREKDRWDILRDGTTFMPFWFKTHEIGHVCSPTSAASWERKMTLERLRLYIAAEGA